MQELKLLVPTYYGDTEGKPAFVTKNEFDEPNVPVLICEAEGVRVVLGSHDFDDTSKPDIQIERRPSGWAIFLHPEPGGDPSGFVYFLDDGRSFVVPDGSSCTDQIKVVDRCDQVPMIDDPPVAHIVQHRFAKCPKLAAAWIQAQRALQGESNDDEHDALLALVEAIETVEVELHESELSGVATPHIVAPPSQNTE